MSLCLVWCSANSRSLAVGCCLSGVASLACSHRLAFSSISIINNRSLVPQCLSASCGALALLLLAANSRSLAVGCCLSAYVVQFATGKALAANSRSLAVGCCLSGVASLACSHKLAFSSLSIINSRSLVPQCLSASCVACSQQPLVGVSMPLCLMWCSCFAPTAAHWL